MTSSQVRQIRELEAQVKDLRSRLVAAEDQIVTAMQLAKTLEKENRTLDAQVQMLLGIIGHIDGYAVTMCDPEGRVVYENHYGQTINGGPDYSAPVEDWEGAYGQMVSLDTGKVIPPERWPLALGLAGLPISGARVRLNGRKLLISAGPHVIDGEVWGWAIWKPLDVDGES